MNKDSVDEFRYDPNWPPRRNSEKARTHYTDRESRLIIAYLLKKQQFSKLGGDSVWKLMSSSRKYNPGGRTYHSIRERFRSYLVPRLSEFVQPHEEDLILGKVPPPPRPVAKSDTKLKNDNRKTDAVAQMPSTSGDVSTAQSVNHGQRPAKKRKQDSLAENLPAAPEKKKEKAKSAQSQILPNTSSSTSEQFEGSWDSLLEARLNMLEARRHEISKRPNMPRLSHDDLASPDKARGAHRNTESMDFSRLSQSEETINRSATLRVAYNKLFETIFDSEMYEEQLEPKSRIYIALLTKQLQKGLRSHFEQIHQNYESCITLQCKGIKTYLSKWNDLQTIISRIDKQYRRHVEGENKVLSAALKELGTQIRYILQTNLCSNEKLPDRMDWKIDTEELYKLIRYQDRVFENASFRSIVACTIELHRLTKND